MSLEEVRQVLPSGMEYVPTDAPGLGTLPSDEEKLNPVKWLHLVDEHGLIIYFNEDLEVVSLYRVEKAKELKVGDEDLAGVEAEDGLRLWMPLDEVRRNMPYEDDQLLTHTPSKSALSDEERKLRDVGVLNLGEDYGVILYLNEYLEVVSIIRIERATELEQ